VPGCLGKECDFASVRNLSLRCDRRIVWVWGRSYLLVPAAALVVADVIDEFYLQKKKKKPRKPDYTALDREAAGAVGRKSETARVSDLHAPVNG